ncbi:co-chaperone YbbN [Mobilicoccus caccae]|uniref:Thioredoxin n=1 Tax=Mobilicoccus caccae TaxID=1859295 RepID=A0ABQ6ILZ4_9MICO|nr:tetratricopeptide repeat protein [Mobilicoccus caccae]GMA38771.1 thioredoxin [Mobilicoccus caccae]
MTEQPGIRSSALRGAVDLSSLGQGPTGGEATGGGVQPGSIRVDATEATFEELMLSTREVPAIVVLWSASHPETEKAVTDSVAVAERLGGRLRVIGVDVDAARAIASAFQAQQIPMTVAVIAAQPMPLYPGLQPVEQMEKVFAEVVKVAGENGVNGRIDVGAEPAEQEPEPLSPEHQAAYDAIEQGDFAAAVEAYEAALKKNPKDADAAAGLANVSLMERTQGADLDTARRAAADAPDDIDAQLLVADLDVLGGHVEDAFSRLIDLVRRTIEDDRERVRTRLVELFEVVGAQDERVVKARRALMSALF